ncbi:SANT/Myb_domain [Hexamita inflata]|uniref:SANT/Myb domain n=2 Tax=Hexamita inflata TaxID=28002 RepID=A0AA86QT97_9EUKA|nr:SANT/Myb domain [Hexamita inflata]
MIKITNTPQKFYCYVPNLAISQALEFVYVNLYNFQQLSAPFGASRRTAEIQKFVESGQILNLGITLEFSGIQHIFLRSRGVSLSPCIHSERERKLNRAPNTVSSHYWRIWKYRESYLKQYWRQNAISARLQKCISTPTMNRDINNQLIENIALLQEIHSLNHLIETIQFSSMPKQRKHWTKGEDELLTQAVNVFGTEDVDKLAQVMVSKTREQIYFRVRYVLNNPVVYRERNIVGFQ